MTRENFSASTRKKLAERVGQTCSYPGCALPTSGPSGTDEVARVGMACHIYPASGAGPRATSPRPQGLGLRDIENGVWMCWSHGTIVDQDDGRFTPAMLREYRRLAEDAASERIFGQAHAGTRSLIANEKRVDFMRVDGTWQSRLPESWRATLATALQDGGVAALWGEDAQHSVWMLFAELTRNTAEHGKGVGVSVRTSGNTAELVMFDETFGLEDLKSATSQRGAWDSLRQIWDGHRDELLVNSVKLKDGIAVQITGVARASLSDPCSIEIVRHTPIEDQLQQVRDCSTAHLYTPEHLMRSDGPIMTVAARAALNAGRYVAIHYRRAQEALVRGPIEAALPEHLERLSFFEIA